MVRLLIALVLLITLASTLIGYLSGCGDVMDAITGNYGACRHLDGSCTEHSYEHECYEAGGIKWWDGYEC